MDFRHYYDLGGGLGSAAYAQDVAWQDPEIIGINKEEPRATFYFYDNEEQALAGGHNFSVHKYYQSLNGIWNFKWSKT